MFHCSVLLFWDKPFCKKKNRIFWHRHCWWVRIGFFILSEAQIHGDGFLLLYWKAIKAGAPALLAAVNVFLYNNVYCCVNFSAPILFKGEWKVSRSKSKSTKKQAESYVIVMKPIRNNTLLTITINTAHSIIMHIVFQCTKETKIRQFSDI